MMSVHNFNRIKDVMKLWCFLTSSGSSNKLSFSQRCGMSE